MYVSEILHYLLKWKNRAESKVSFSINEIDWMIDDILFKRFIQQSLIITTLRSICFAYGSTCVRIPVAKGLSSL